MRPDEMWEGRGAKELTVRTLLTPASWLYAFGWEAYLGIYRLGLKRAAEPHRPVICIGSLMVGGSGKSPLTVHLAKLILSMGRPVVIGSSGYGAPHSEAAALAPDGPLAASEWGDEPAMFRWFLPEVPQVVGRRRVLAAELVHERYPDAVLLMDDGFQHLPLKKQTTLLIDDPSVRNKRCLPAGPHREPRWNRRRASAIIPDDFRVVREPMRMVTPEGTPETPEAYGVLCALGQPGRFLAGLAEQFPNAASISPVLLMDHDPLTGAGIWDDIPAELPIVVTAKDWVKLRDRADVGTRKFLIALQDVHLEPLEAFKTWVERRIDE